MESELAGVLAASEEFTSREARGGTWVGVCEMVEGAEGMSGEEKEGCKKAMRYLQVGFDVWESGEGGVVRHQMIFSWTMLVESGFTAVLGRMRAEALVVLAYYAVLLHYGRGLWQVGDVGTYLLDMIERYLGPEWDKWMRVPREMVARTF